MTKITDKELAALRAIISASEQTTGSKTDGWWSNEILLYAKDCPLAPKTFAAVCGTLSKKGLVVSGKYDAGLYYIYATADGVAAVEGVQS
jgi:hypothetical protein